MKTDIQIAQEATLKPIKEVAASIGISEDDLELYGKYKAKISDSLINSTKNNPDGKLILVTAINPTPAGEGKTTTSVGLGQAFGKLGKKALIALREPSLGPCFGIKGGAAGGGYAQVVPMEDLNLHFTGDFHAITSANNLLAALLRACEIPAGICYQRLTLDDGPENGFCIHALNAVYIKSLDRWIRLDARGNKEGVDAQFDLEKERLAFPVRKDCGEVDYRIIYANPSNKLMQVLENNTDALYMCLNCLPESMFEYKRAAIEDIDELVLRMKDVVKSN